YALLLALCLLRAYAAAYGGKRGGFGNYLIGALEITFGYFAYECGDIYAHGTAAAAGLVFAVEASCSLVHGLLLGISECNFVEIAYTLTGGLDRHFVLFKAHIRHITLPP